MIKGEDMVYEYKRNPTLSKKEGKNGKYLLIRARVLQQWWNRTSCNEI